MKYMIFPTLAASVLAGCASTGDVAAADPSAEVPMVCNAEAVQYHVGHDATQAMGTAILKESGARNLRWGAPDSAWTMDYRQDRVNVRYDAAMKITAVTCG